MFDKEQDKLATSLVQIDQVEAQLTDVEATMGSMEGTIKRISNNKNIQR